MKTYRFAFLACSASKLSQAAPAKDIYTGALFKLAYRYADLMADRILILSAKHGLVDVECVIEPYDERLTTDKHRRATWGSNVASQLLKVTGVKDRTSISEGRAIGATCLCLAPQSYVSAIGFQYVTGGWHQPLKGLGIGQQKHWLAKAIKESRPSQSLSAMVLELDRAFAGDADAPFEMPSSTWAKLVAAAKGECS